MDNVQFWYKVAKNLLYLRQKTFDWCFASVAFLKKIKVKLWYFCLLVSGCSLEVVLVSVVHQPLWLQVFALYSRCPSPTMC